MMSKAELGTKCTCAGCGQRFYDLNRTPGTCPKCGVEQPPEKPRAVRPSRTSFGTRRLFRQPDPVFAAEEAEPAAAPDLEDPDAEDTEPAPEPDEEIDDDVLEIVPGHDKEVA
jgi:uncharacterized protein (TIGR02300 family)